MHPAIRDLRQLVSLARDATRGRERRKTAYAKVVKRVIVYLLALLIALSPALSWSCEATGMMRGIPHSESRGDMLGSTTQQASMACHVHAEDEGAGSTSETEHTCTMFAACASVSAVLVDDPLLGGVSAIASVVLLDAPDRFLSADSFLFLRPPIA